MSNPELDEIMASVQAAISRAYALGRLDALKHVITTMEAEESGAAAPKPLALMAPAPQPSEAAVPEATVSQSTAAPVQEPAQPNEPSVVQTHPDPPANGGRVKVLTEEDTSHLPWYRRPAK